MLVFEFPLFLFIFGFAIWKFFRQASVALNVWQPEIVRGRHKQIVEQSVMPAKSRVHALEMELRLCRQQISGIHKSYVWFSFLQFSMASYVFLWRFENSLFGWSFLSGFCGRKMKRGGFIRQMRNWAHWSITRYKIVNYWVGAMVNAIPTLLQRD